MARPRDPDIDRRVLLAAAELLREGGYASLSFEDVALRTGISKPSIYRRWPSPAQLAFAAATHSTMIDPIPDSGDLRRDLLDAVTTLAERLQVADRTLLGDQVGAMIADGDFSEAAQQRRLRPDAEAVAAIWDRAAERGEVRADVDGVEFFEDLAAVLVYRVLVLHRSPGEADLELLVDRLLSGVRC